MMNDERWTMNELFSNIYTDIISCYSFSSIIILFIIILFMCRARKHIYRIILEQIDDESKLQISCKLCQNILGPLVDNDELDNISNDLESPALNLVKDTFAVLCSKELKTGSGKRMDDDEITAEVMISKKIVLNKVK